MDKGNTSNSSTEGMSAIWMVLFDPAGTISTSYKKDIQLNMIV